MTHDLAESFELFIDVSLAFIHYSGVPVSAVSDINAILNARGSLKYDTLSIQFISRNGEDKDGISEHIGECQIDVAQIEED